MNGVKWRGFHIDEVFVFCAQCGKYVCVVYVLHNSRLHTPLVHIRALIAHEQAAAHGSDGGGVVQFSFARLAAVVWLSQ